MLNFGQISNFSAIFRYFHHHSMMAVFSIFILGLTRVHATYELSWKVDLPLTLGAIGVYSGGNFAKSRMEPYQDGSYDKSSLLPWDRPFAGTWSEQADAWSTKLRWALYVPMGSMVVGKSIESKSARPAFTALVMFSQVYAIQDGLYSAVRALEVWPRPFLLGSKGGDARKENSASGSFYSGHSSSAFAMATFTSTWFQHEYQGSRWIPWMWTGTLSTAGAVAILRVRAGRHYPSDVLVGALVGSGIGVLVPWLHERDVGLAPLPGGAMVSLAF